MRRSLRATLVLLVLLGSLPAATSAPAGAARAHRFVARGEVKAPGALFLTFEEWNLFTCPELPRTQGVSSYFIALPARFQGGGDQVEVTGGNLSGGYPFQLNFWAEDCTPILTSINAPTLIPEGTVFIEVFQNFEAAAEFELVVGPSKPPS